LKKQYVCFSVERIDTERITFILTHKNKKKMGKKLFAILMVAVVATFAGYNIYQSQRMETMSDLMLANVEALAYYEGDDTIDPNKAYGYKLVNCLDKFGAAKGARCISVEDSKSSCAYSSAWGKCD
jgi:hypothetical protein